MAPTPRNKELYEKIKRQVYKQIPTHSAYRSGILVKKYKEAYGKGKPYIEQKKPQTTGLSRWFKEDWKSDTGKYRYTSESSVYRPTVRVTSKTPRTFSEITPKQLAKAKRQKREKGRASWLPNKK